MIIHEEKLYEYVTVFHKNEKERSDDLNQLISQGWERISSYNYFNYKIEDLDKFEKKYGNDFYLEFVYHNLFSSKPYKFEVLISKHRRELLTNFKPEDFYNL